MTRNRNRLTTRPALCWTLLLLIRPAAVAAPNDYFAIRVVDRESGRGVPLVELTTTNNLRYVTDSAGYVAFHEPGLMDTDVYFHIASHGYRVPPDGFGYSGVKLHTTPGEATEVAIQRINIAQRLYRVTGQGIYRDSLLLGHSAPIEQPLLNGEVMGQDSVQAAVYHNHVFWVWGDTARVSYPLGNFGSSGATSRLPNDGGLDPRHGIDLRYFTDTSGFSRPMVSETSIVGPGPRWLSGLSVLTDPEGHRRLIAALVRVKDLGEALERGLVVLDDKTDTFEHLASFPRDSRMILDGHPIRVRDGGGDYLYFGFGPPFFLRVPADWRKIQSVSAYQGFTCVTASESPQSPPTDRVERDEHGRLIYRWRDGRPPLDGSRTPRLQPEDAVAPGETWPAFLDIDTGKPVTPHGGSLYWNTFLRRYVAIFNQLGGDRSYLGEVWYAAVDTPSGPTAYAKKIATHNHYSFYNPAQHDFFDQQSGRHIFFEGTYSHTFSKATKKTPRYDYNQLMYSLDLTDPRLALPAPVYRVERENGRTQYLMRDAVQTETLWESVREIPFFALPPTASRSDGKAVYAEHGDQEATRLVVDPTSAGGEPLFRIGDHSTGPNMVALTEIGLANGQWEYRTFDRLDPPAEQDDVRRKRTGVLGSVWRSPLRGALLTYSSAGNLVRVVMETAAPQP